MMWRRKNCRQWKQKMVRSVKLLSCCCVDEGGSEGKRGREDLTRAEMKTESASLRDEIHRLIQELSLSKSGVEQLKESLETSRIKFARLSDTYACCIFR